MDHSISSQSVIESELYFLIARFLSAGPCSRTSKVFLEELEEFKLLPKRVDWEGNEHFRTYENLVYLNRHIRSDHLLRIVERIGPVLDKEIKPSVAGVRSLLGAGSLSLLRKTEDIERTKWNTVHHIVRQHGAPKYPPSNLAAPHITHVLPAYHMSGVVRHHSIVPASLYSKISLHGRKLGHLDSVYCILFDRTGNYIFTGADDTLVKIWSRFDMRLLATLRGHSAEITDMAVSYDNIYLASVSLDKSVRIWNLATKAPAAVLHAHSSMITSVQFCPKICGDTRYLVSTGNDGGVCFWHYNCVTNVFNQKPIKFIEKSRAGAQMLCSSFSPGGAFLATGSSDHVVRVYFLHAAGPEKICELEAHGDKVDSICYSNHHNSFVSGSNDGTARIWRYEKQEWRAVVLNVSSKLNKPCETRTAQGTGNEQLRVTMVSWTKDDAMVATAASDFTIKIWNAYSGNLLRTLEGHEDEVYVLEASPTDPRILVSAGHDGKLFIWDITTGTKVKKFSNLIEGQGHGAVFDCKFSPCGQYFAATDSHGHLLLMGFGVNDRCKKIPQQLFFHSDYRPLIRDANGYCLDEQTQQPPHLMTLPFLVDIDGNPYPPAIQRLVPGRENAKESSLIPHMAVNAAGDSEVIGERETNNEQAQDEEGAENSDTDVDVEGSAQASTPARSVPGRGVRPSIDALIQELQRQQDVRLGTEAGSSSSNQVMSPPALSSPPPTPRGNSRVGMRRSGEVEGVRQSRGNVSSVASTTKERIARRRQVTVRPMDPISLKMSEEHRSALSEEEVKRFLSERKKKLLSPVGTTTAVSTAEKNRRQKPKAPSSRTVYLDDILENVETARNRLTTRALYDTEEEEDEGGGSDWESDSSEDYSDWVGDQGSSNLEPPKRRSQRKRKYRRLSSSDESDNKEEEEEQDEENDSSSTEVSSGGEEAQRTDRERSSPRKSNATEKGTKKKQPKKVAERKRKPGSVERSKEMDEKMRPTEWITTVIPRKAPFVPQMGDEVVYFRQGHEQYLHAVIRKDVYKVDLDKNQPWHKIPNLKAHEFVKIVGIKWLMKPARLCCMKLAFIDVETGKLTGKTFSIRYHDMPDVIDFIVLRQHYDISIERGWKQGSKFRSMIDDQWWLGVIKSKEALSPHFPDSLYQCFNVHWDNGEFEKLSPWDMEPVDPKRKPAQVGGGVDVTVDEYKALLYVPKKTEWTSCGREKESLRLIRGIGSIMQHSWAEPFSAPVDLQRFPTYSYFVPYPIDLSTIKTRLENGFYRRVTALQWDVRLIHTNAIIFNQSGSSIVKNANAVTESLLRFFKDHDCLDPLPFLHEHSQGSMKSRTSDDDSHLDTKQGKGSRGKKSSSTRANPDAWLEDCESLLAMLFECEDSEPFRLPVDPNVYPEYEDIVTNPMDLTTVHTKLATGNYQNPITLSRDIRLIFNNSKLYNTNKRSRIYTMTLRLSALFEDQIKKITTRWKSVGGNLTRERKVTRNMHSRNEAGTSWSGMDSLIEDGPSTSGLNMPSTSRASVTTSIPKSSKESRYKTPAIDSDDSDATIVDESDHNRKANEDDDDDDTEVCDDGEGVNGFQVANLHSEDDDDHSDTEYKPSKTFLKKISRTSEPSKSSSSSKGKSSKRAKPKSSQSLANRTKNHVKRSNYAYSSDDGDEETSRSSHQFRDSSRKSFVKSSHERSDESSDNEVGTASSSHQGKQTTRKSGRLKKGSYSRRFSPEIGASHSRKKRMKQVKKRKIDSDDEDEEETKSDNLKKRMKQVKRKIDSDDEDEEETKSDNLKRSARSSRSARAYYGEDDSDEANDNVNDADTDLNIDEQNDNSESEEVSSSEELDDDSEDEIINTSIKTEFNSSKSKAHNGHSRPKSRKRRLDDSDAEENDSDSFEKPSGKRAAKSVTPPVSKGGKSNSIRTRNRGKQRVTYMEDSDDEDAAGQDDSISLTSDYDDSPTNRSVSCRGRLRKLTPRAKASLKGF